MPAAQLPPVYAAARVHAIDRYLAALLAPRTVRDDLIALAAFAGEIERIPLAVSDPNLGEIRLQWWGDWLDGVAAPGGERGPTGHPVADALGEVLIRRGLPTNGLATMIDARRADLWADPVVDQAAWAKLVTEQEAGAFDLAARVLGTPAELGPVACAYGLTRQLVRLPQIVARRGRWPLPQDRHEVDVARLAEPAMRAAADAARSQAIAAAVRALQVARTHVRALPKGAIAAALAVAVVGPHLRTLSGQKDWLSRTSELTPLERVWRLGLAKLSGHLVVPVMHS